MRENNKVILQKHNKEEKVYQTFEAIAKEYDLMNDLISLGQHRKWKEEVVLSLSSNNKKGILDVCCGTGDLTRLLAQSYPDIQITGLDYSPKMLEVAENNRLKFGLNNIVFKYGNAMALPFEDDTFSHTIISFGLRNCPDYGQVIKEMRRVIAPGGLVVCLETSYPRSIIRPFFKIYFKYLMPGFAALLHRHYHEYAWLNKSTEMFLSKKDLATLFQSCGLKDVGYQTYMFGTCAQHYGRK